MNKTIVRDFFVLQIIVSAELVGIYGDELALAPNNVAHKMNKDAVLAQQTCFVVLDAEFLFTRVFDCKFFDRHLKHISNAVSFFTRVMMLVVIFNDSQQILVKFFYERFMDR